MNLTFLRKKLESPKDENERLWAYGTLKQMKIDIDNLLLKYGARLERDWTKETVSDK